METIDDVMFEAANRRGIANKAAHPAVGAAGGYHALAQHLGHTALRMLALAHPDVFAHYP